MSTRFRLCWLLLLLGPLRAEAQTVLDTTVVMPEVQVEDTRARTDRATASGRLTTLDATDLAAVNAHSVADVLETRTGLFVKRYGSGLATLSLRGTGSAHTLLLLDGLRMADPQTGQIDLSLLPTVLLESIEVFHGTSSALYGSGALGGVVRLGTLGADGSSRIKLSGGYGAYGDRTLGAVVSGGSGRLSALVSAEVNREDGDFAYLNETLFPPQDVRREGADRSLVTLFSRATYRGERQKLSVAGWLNQTERGLPGPGNAPSGEARQWDDYLRLWATHTTGFPWGSLNLNAAFQTTRLRYVNPLSATDDTSRTRTLDLDARANLVAHRRWLFVSGATLGLDHTDLRGGIDQTRAASFIQGTGEYGRWRVFPALRLDVYITNGETTWALTPRLGLNVQPLATGAVHLKGSIGRAFRMPTFNERFYQPSGNPDLEPERGWSADAGIHAQTGEAHRRLEAEVSVFSTRLHDQIVWFPSLVGPGVQVWRPANISRVVTRGIEASLRGQTLLADAFVLNGSFTFTHTDARDRSNPAAASYNQPLRYVPQQQLKLYLGTGWRGWHLDLSGRLVGHRFIATDGTMALPVYRVVDAQMRYEHTLGPATATLALGVENVLDSDYAIVRFYPMPPRHARVRLTLDFHP